jgi:predicted enzyme related to lactoylglutathione lyase
MGNPFVHLDLSTDDPTAAKAFYGRIFDWKFNEVPGMGGWSGIVVGKGVGGGIGGKNMPGQPTAWTAYVEVKDVKQTIEKAQAAGANIMVPYMEVPGMGALGVFLDPQGASIGVWQTFARPKKAAKKAAKKAPKKAPKKAAKKKAGKKKR